MHACLTRFASRAILSLKVYECQISVMNSRKEQLLQLIIEEYVDSTEPVGSQFLIESSDLEWSAATVRNEMRELEDTGYLTHPHTSAGRIPTEAGYRYYVDHLMSASSPKKSVARRLQESLRMSESFTEEPKAVAKQVSELAGAAVIIALDPDTVYYTGLGNLFSQPEFFDSVRAIDISSEFDHCEEHIESIFDAVEQDQTTVLIGSEHEFGADCSLVATRLGSEALMAIVAPMRMRYAQSVGLMNFLRDLL